MLFQIGDNKVPMFRIRQVAKVLGQDVEAIRKKEQRNQVLETPYRNSRGQRLYTIEDIAAYDYLFRHVWRGRQGRKQPEEFKKAARKVFEISQREVEEYGKVTGSDVFNPAQEIWPEIIPGELYSKILLWRSILLEEPEEKEEVCQTAEIETFDVNQFLDNF